MKRLGHRALRSYRLLISLLLLLACNFPYAEIGRPTPIFEKPAADATVTSIADVTTAPGDEDDPLAVRPATIHPTLPDVVFTLFGAPPETAGAPPTIHRLEVAYAGEETPFQTLADLEARPRLGDDVAGFVVEDMNFDGYRDLRLMEEAPAGPNVPYRVWLFDPETGQFVANEALSQITSPQVDSVRQQIISRWRSDAATSGTDVWAWENGEMVLIRQEVRTYVAEGTYQLTVRERVDGDLVVVEEREVAQGPEATPSILQFDPGAISGTVEGTLEDQRAHTYRLNALADQLMIVALRPTPLGTHVEIEIVGDEGPVVPLGTQSGLQRMTWLGWLPATGTYLLRLQSGLPPVDYEAIVLIETPEPETIRFDPGAISDSVSGTLEGVDVATYQLRAAADQTMTLALTPGDNELLLAVMGMDGLIIPPSAASPEAAWTGQLPSTQDYLVVVAGAGGRHDYTLDVTITSPE